ncbi:hypothetical protein AB1Y20_006595 [Prymnesium parvum]|uniref:Peroxisomal membrane protein MPV17 n=1 Tax=Prymnesium parvum TaxID=97485 RepID=A0AB34IXU6_PRYPA
MLKYERLLLSHPLATKSLTSALVTGAGDLFCQLGVERADALDRPRLAAFTAVGGLLVAPVLHGWYSLLNSRFPGRRAPAVALRLVLDQALFAPIFLPVVMGSALLTEGQAEPRATLSREWWPALLVNWQLWVPAQLINFRWMPPHYQVLFANGVGLVWNTYLSYVSHSELH